MGASDTNRNGLQIRYASYSANEWIGPMKEAPSVEGASLVSGTPPSGSPRGWGTGDGSGVVSLSGKISSATVTRWRWPFFIGLVLGRVSTQVCRGR